MLRALLESLTQAGPCHMWPAALCILQALVHTRCTFSSMSLAHLLSALSICCLCSKARTAKNGSTPRSNARSWYLHPFTDTNASMHWQHTHTHCFTIGDDEPLMELAEKVDAADGEAAKGRKEQNKKKRKVCRCVHAPRFL